MIPQRLSELLFVQTDLRNEGVPVTAVYELDRKERIARMSLIEADKIRFTHTIYSPHLPKNDEEIILDLYRDFKSSGWLK